MLMFIVYDNDCTVFAPHTYVECDKAKQVFLVLNLFPDYSDLLIKQILLYTVYNDTRKGEGVIYTGYSIRKIIL